MRRSGRYLRYLSFLVALTTLAPCGFLLADEVDILSISRDFTSLPRSLIVVLPVPQPSKSGGKLEIADSLGRIMTEELVASLQRELPTAKVVASEGAPAQSEGLLSVDRSATPHPTGQCQVLRLTVPPPVRFLPLEGAGSTAPWRPRSSG